MDPTTLSRPYCKVSDVQVIAGASDPDLDDLFRASINKASRMVEELTGRDFWFHDHASDRYTVRRCDVLGDAAFLPFPIITLTAINLDGVDVALSDAYFEVGRDVLYSENGEWGCHPFRGTLLLTGTFGFALAESAPESTPPPGLPESIVRATALIASAFSGEWRKERVAPDGVRESLLEIRIPAEAKNLLRQWNRRGLHSVF